MGTPRVRSGTYRYLYVTLGFSTDTDPGNWSRNLITRAWTQNGYDNPTYRSRIEAGLDASSAYTTSGGKMKVFSVRNLTGTYNQTYGGKVYVRNAWHYSNGRPSFKTPTFLDDNARNKALGRFYRKLSDVYQSFDGLTFIGELLSTRRMILERAGDLLNIMKRDHRNALRLARRARGSQVRKKIYSRAYLEATFGWLPFFSDLENMYTAFNHEVQPIVRIRSSEVSEKDPIVSKVLAGTGIFTWDVYTKEVYDVKYSFVAGVRPDWDKPDAFGLSARNVLPAAWELIPWSFAIDYFVDIQGWLLSKVYSSIQPIYCVEGVLQTYKERVREVLAHNRYQGQRNFQAGTCLDNLSTTYRFSRSSLGSLPQMKGPTLRGIPSAKQLLNLAALFSARSDFSNL